MKEGNFSPPSLLFSERLGQNHSQQSDWTRELSPSVGKEDVDVSQFTLQFDNLGHSYGRSRLLCLDILQLLTLKSLDSLQDSLDGLLCLNLFLARQHDFLHGLGGLQIFTLKPRDTCRETNQCYSARLSVCLSPVMMF